MLLTLTATFIAIIGLVLTGGGGWLLSLGGSAYYLVTGIAFLLTADLLFRRSAAALWLYALVVLGSLGWALWEVGFDWWQLGPRGGVLVLLGIWLLGLLAQRVGNQTRDDSMMLDPQELRRLRELAEAKRAQSATGEDARAP